MNEDTKTTIPLTERQIAFVAELERVRAEAKEDPDDAWLLFINAGFTMEDAKALHDRGVIYTSRQMGMPAARIKPPRPHLIGGEFQSDKYPTTPRGKVPLSCKDKTAQDLLWIYAQRRRVVDAEFADDLEEALRIAGYERGAGPDDLAREVERRREAEARLEWQPIETAPRDKTMVVLLLRSGSYARYGIGWWNVHDWVGWLGENRPTHWASLPKVLADRQGGSPNG